MGAYPTVVDWNNDGKHDLLVGDTNGGVTVFINTESNTNPILDSGTKIKVGGQDLWVGERATPVVSDWDGDGRKDLLVGELDGFINVYINEGTDASPTYNSSSYLQVGGANFDVGSRSAPRIYDWNHDGKQDLIVGEYTGYVYYLENKGTNSAPVFNSSEKLLLEDGVTPLDYGAGAPRSRIFVTDWNEDDLPDMVVGGVNGDVQLYTAVAPEPVSSTLFIVGSVVIGFRNIRRKYYN